MRELIADPVNAKYRNSTLVLAPYSEFNSDFREGLQGDEVGGDNLPNVPIMFCASVGFLGLLRT